MTRRQILLAACFLGVAEMWLIAHIESPARQRRPIPPVAESNIQEALAAYAEGDDLAVERWLATSGTIPTLAGIETVAARPALWSRVRPAFLLEIAVHQPHLFSNVLVAGRSLLVSRPSPLGTDPIEDRFEVLWHQAALGIAQQLPDVSLQQQYLDSIGRRFENAQRRGITLATRLPLARAIAAGLACCWKRVAGEIVRVIPRSARSAATLEAALTLFEHAALLPELRAEALIRGGKLLYDAGRHTDALAWLERVPPHADSTLAYVHHFTLGRVLDILNRPADAAAAYGAALALAPGSQRAGVGLAAALLRAGRGEDAAGTATIARRLPGEGTVHFSEFHAADSRFVREWLAEIRRLRR